MNIIADPRTGEGVATTIRRATRPRDHELIVFTKAPRRSGLEEGVVYQVERAQRGPWRLVIVATMATGYPRSVYVEIPELDHSIWRPATPAERDAAFP